MHGHDTNIKNSEQLFNRQFLCLSHEQSEALCKKRQEWALHWMAGQKQQSYGPLWPDLLLEPSKGTTPKNWLSIC